MGCRNQGRIAANAASEKHWIRPVITPHCALTSLWTDQSGITLWLGTSRLPIRRAPSKLCAMLAVSRRLRVDGVLQLISPGPPIRRSTQLPVKDAYVSEQADDRVLLRVDSINKQYADEAVLADIAFDIQAGEIVGIIGPNGAGKTTLLEALAGILPAETSDVQWLGKPLPPSRRREAMFYLPDAVRPYQDQPVIRVLSFFADVHRRSTDEITGAIEAVGLTPVLHKRMRSLSKGYGRRVVLALGLLAPHSLLLMDEPFDGFDLRQTREISGVLRKEVAKGRTFVLAIHQLLDAERVCDRFILLANGRVRGAGTLNELRARTGLTSGSLEDIFLALT
jgi:ABC-2 type transport system ATP-binding protein